MSRPPHAAGGRETLLLDDVAPLVPRTPRRHLTCLRAHRGEGRTRPEQPKTGRLAGRQSATPPEPIGLDARTREPPLGSQGALRACLPCGPDRLASSFVA